MDYGSKELQEWINPKLDVSNDLANTFFVKIDEMKMNQNKAENKAIQDMNHRQATLAEESQEWGRDPNNPLWEKCEDNWK